MVEITLSTKTCLLLIMIEIVVLVMIIIIKNKVNYIDLITLTLIHKVLLNTGLKAHVWILIHIKNYLIIIMLIYNMCYFFINAKIPMLLDVILK